MALTRLGREKEAATLLEKIARYGSELAATPGSIQYFATSLPTMLLFHEDLDEVNRREGLKLQAGVSRLQGDDAAHAAHVEALRDSKASDSDIYVLEKLQLNS